jgi:hypothetical protein
MWYEEEENAAEHDTETYAHQSSESLIKVVLRYELLASLTWGITPVPPAKGLQASGTGGTWHSTICYLAAFVHELIFPEDPLKRKRMVLFLSYSKFITRKDATIL